MATNIEQRQAYSTAWDAWRILVPTSCQEAVAVLRALTLSGITLTTDNPDVKRQLDANRMCERT